ncbi:MAG TPA: hypothetical protein VJ964_01955 [Balneolaceae bacterium]|nr:hypothetical protein [Balneolaceae bacterium]
MRKTAVLLLLLMGISTSCLAQFYPTQYRPAGQHWQYLSTPHFKLIYAQGNDSTALRMGRILEKHYRPTQNLVGGQLQQFPVILNSYNDRSNGFVTPFHFRSEIELPPMKGKALNPKTGNWLENVAPHELTHAMQFSHLGSYNIPRLVSIFSPDLARSFHGAIPSGMLEGIAVQHETEGVSQDGGRGNFPLFTNQFNAVFKSNQRWSMGQMMQISSYSRPFDRHYIGGYEFTGWLQAQYGSSTTRKALDFYMDFPFLGYGVALRHVTGLWPGQLYHRFEKAKEKELSDKGPSSRGTELSIPYKGRNIRRPEWLSNSKLIFYGSFYNARAGFYSYDMGDDHIAQLLTTNSVADYRYDLSSDRSKMVFSYYEADPIYDNTSKAELVQYNFSSGKKYQLTKHGRVYAPAFSGDTLLALQTRPASSQLVSVGDQIHNIASLGRDQIIAVQPNPVTDQWAVVANKRGMQALWIVNARHPEKGLKQLPDISFSEGSIFDPAWSPDGKKLLFSSGFSGTNQIYEYNLKTRSVTQITNTAFNAMEASYSPDGQRIAFIKQDKNERLPVVLKQTDFFNKKIPDDRWQPNQSKQEFMQRPAVPDSLITESHHWKTNSYSDGTSWLKPRTVLPVFNEVSNRGVYQTGFSLNSNNLLADQSYSAEFAYMENRGWYDIQYQNKSFYPGFKARFYSQPSYRYFESGTQNSPNIFTLLRQERSLSLSIPFSVRLNQNIFNTSFFIEPEIRQSQIRYFEPGNVGSKSNFGDQTIANIYGQFDYRLQQDIRDVQPNSGLILFSEIERHLSSDSINLTAYGNNISISGRNETAFHGGLYAFLSPLRRWNQSLRLGLRGITQSGLIFDNQSLVSDAFSEPVLINSRNLLSFSTRYTIPLTYVDNGGFLLPLYLSNIYLVAFTDTVTDPTFSHWYKGSRSVFGIGIRAHFRLSNLGFNIGVGYGYEPTRQASEFFIGNF